MKAALAQINAKVGDLAGNARLLAEAARAAHVQGATLVLAPELALTGYPPEDLLLRPAFMAACVEALQALASDLADCAGLHLIVGHPHQFGVHGDVRSKSMAVQQRFNAASVLAGGQVLGTYCKRELPNYQVFDERRYFASGRDAGLPALVVEINGLRIGVLICYDLRFPEAARMCALDGADLIALPTNWPEGVDFHPGIFAPARATENHCYLLAADRVGTERGVTFIGRSLLIDYDGHQLAVASDTEEELLIGEVDPAAARQTHVRRRPGEHEWDTIADRRPGLYRRLLEPAVDRQRTPSEHRFSGEAD